MKTAEKQITTRLNPRWCRPDDADKNYKLMEVLRPAVLGSSDSLGVHRSGAWSHSVRPGMPLPAAGARAHRCAPGSLPSRWPWTAASRQDRGPHHAAIQGQRPFFFFFLGGEETLHVGPGLASLSASSSSCSRQTPTAAAPCGTSSASGAYAETARACRLTQR